MEENGNDFDWESWPGIIISFMIIVAGFGAAQNDPDIISIIPMISATPIIEQNNDSRVNAILANIDPEIRKRIVSINIIDKEKIRQHGSDFGYVNIKKNIFGNLVAANIYIVDNYDNECYTFEYVLYHEIGHVEEAYKYGYAETMEEDYANNFADQYIKINCERR